MPSTSFVLFLYSRVPWSDQAFCQHNFWPEELYGQKYVPGWCGCGVIVGLPLNISVGAQPTGKRAVSSKKEFCCRCMKIAEYPKKIQLNWDAQDEMPLISVRT
jgi:hypothetical protein